MTRSTQAFLALLVALSAACGGPAKSSTPVEQIEPPAEPVSLDGQMMAAPDLSRLVIPGSPALAPASLQAEVVLSNPNHQITQVATFVDAVQPGMGAFVTPQTLMQMFEGMVGAVGIAGIDLNSPLFVTILDGERFVMVATVASEADLMDSLSSGATQAITHDGFAAIGKPEALMEIAPYALSNLVKQPMPDKPTLSLHVAKIMGGSHGDEVRNDIRQNVGSGGSEAVGAEIAIETLSNIEVLHTSLDASTAAATIAMHAVVRDGPLKAFIAKQGPANFALVDRIGTGPWGMFVAGRLDTSALSPLLAKMAAAEGNPILTQLIAQVRNLSGEMAMALNMPKNPELALAMELVDADSMAKILDGVVALAASQPSQEMGGIPTTLKAASLKTRGGSLHELKLNPVTPFHKELYGKKGVSAYFGVATGSLIATFGANAKKYANILVTANGKIPGKGKKLAAVASQAKAAGESVFLAMDVLSLQGNRAPSDVDPLVIGIGFSESSIRARVVIPTELVKEAASHGGF